MEIRHTPVSFAGALKEKHLPICAPEGKKQENVASNFKRQQAGCHPLYSLRFLAEQLYDIHILLEADYFKMLRKQNSLSKMRLCISICQVQGFHECSYYKTITHHNCISPYCRNRHVPLLDTYFICFWILHTEKYSHYCCWLWCHFCSLFCKKSAVTSVLRAKSI